jgi:hypothetical protein
MVQAMGQVSRGQVNKYYAQCGQLVEDMHTSTQNTKTVGRTQNKKDREEEGMPRKKL